MKQKFRIAELKRIDELRKDSTLYQIATTLQDEFRRLKPESTSNLVRFIDDYINDVDPPKKRRGRPRGAGKAKAHV